MTKTAIARARVLPYQLLTAYQATSNQMPFEIREALQDAMETAVQNVPAIQGKVVVCPDVSGSMHSSVTGYRGSANQQNPLHRHCRARIRRHVAYQSASPRDTV